jgi:hypothetical protein
MAERSALYRLIDAKLPGTFEEFVAARRPEKSWQTIAEDIAEATGEKVTKQVLRNWFAGRISYAATIDADTSVGAT